MTMIETPDTADDLDEPIVAGDLPADSPADPPDDDALDVASEPADLGDVDLPVHVEIDTLSLSIAELAALRPGYVLELPLAARDVPVRLVAYGQAIGGGRLVAVGAHLGVRIDRMAGDDGSV